MPGFPPCLCVWPNVNVLISASAFLHVSAFEICGNGKCFSGTLHAPIWRKCRTGWGFSFCGSCCCFRCSWCQVSSVGQLKLFIITTITPNLPTAGQQLTSEGSAGSSMAIITFPTTMGRMEIRKCRKTETEVSELRVRVCHVCFLIAPATPVPPLTHTHMNTSPFIDFPHPSSQSKPSYTPKSVKFANVMMLKSVSKYSFALFIFI